MNLSAAVAGALLGAALACTSPAVLRRLTSPEPAVQTQYRALAGNRRARPGRLVVSGAMCGLLAARLGWSSELPVWVLLGAVGTLLAEIDWRTQQLPAALVNPTLLTTAALIAGTSTATSDWTGLVHAGAGWAVGTALFGLAWLASPRSLGYGDVRLGALLGTALGWGSAAAAIGALLLALVLAAAVGLIMRVVGRLPPDGMIPLGPFLVIGSIAVVLLQPG